MQTVFVIILADRLLSRLATKNRLSGHLRTSARFWMPGFVRREAASDEVGISEVPVRAGTWQRFGNNRRV